MNTNISREYSEQPEESEESEESEGPEDSDESTDSGESEDENRTGNADTHVASDELDNLDHVPALYLDFVSWHVQQKNLGFNL